LRCLAGSSFYWCVALKTISLPVSVEIIQAGCFSGCRNLESAIVPFDSKLVRIEGSAFFSCSSLTEFRIPASVEFVGRSCFGGCVKMSGFIIDSPSRLRDLLDIPPAFRRAIAIPDSVEKMVVSGDRQMLEFGADSKLTACSISREWNVTRAFLRFAACTLKRFREGLEFQKCSQPAKYQRWAYCGHF
jgi:hypothetical protein